ncbi:MinD/ParA family protein [Thiomicrorhabdus indica]|uniref:MinD/ParA family protein n=1 Tax=Thiomicrorhabdus indica TaxID=2267253 RepID=UPI00102D6D71|nr:MinD/ParA family protein [Thiomicrorhabdus indica]
MLNDQAASLRAMQKQAGEKPPAGETSQKSAKPTSGKPIRVISVASGKGGVGKTNVSVNIGTALSKLGNRVMLMDADMGLANVDIMLGLQTQYNLSHVLDGQKTLKEVIVEGPAGLKIIPAASGVKRMAQLNAMENAGIINAFSELSNEIDVLMIDTAAGIADSVVSFCRASQEVIVVVTDEPASITDAYALIKVLSRDYGVSRFRLLANMVGSKKEGRMLYEKMASVTEKFLNVTLDYMGAVPYDRALKQAVQRQKPVVITSPNSEAAESFYAMAQEVNRWPIPQNMTGYIQFFVENLFQGQ